MSEGYCEDAVYFSRCCFMHKIEVLRRDVSARVEMDGSSEFERAELFQETLDVAMSCDSAGVWACSAVWSKCWRRRTTTTATYRVGRPPMRGGGRKARVERAGRVLVSILLFVVCRVL